MAHPHVLKSSINTNSWTVAKFASWLRPLQSGSAGHVGGAPRARGIGDRGDKPFGSSHTPLRKKPHQRRRHAWRPHEVIRLKAALTTCPRWSTPMSGRVENNGCIGAVGWKGPEIPPVSATQHAPSPHKLHSDNMLVMYYQQKRHRLIEGRGGETPSGGAHLGSGTNDPSARPPALNQVNARE